MQTNTDLLSQPMTLPCGAILPNRIAKAAMTEQMATPDNRPNAEIIRLYERWGKGGAGLHITGNVMIDRRALEHSLNVVAEDERDLALLEQWANVAKAHRAHVWMQISHPGRQTPKKVTRFPVAPSEVRVKGLEAIMAKPRALREDEIHDLIRRYARTAAIAQKAGFTGVQIHAAHGYLISQFLSLRTNLRKDAWGGTLENRMRFLLEVVKGVREVVGPQFPVAVKLNSADFQRGGFTEDESMQVVAALESLGIDLLEISGGNYENPAMVGQAATTREREAFFMDYALKVRARTKLSLMLTGGFRTAKAMRAALEHGAIDVVGLARPIALEPDLPRRILSGEADRALPINIRVGSKLLDDMMQSFWFNQQMHRMSRGLDPDPKRGLVRTLAVGMYTNLLWNPFETDRVKRYAEPAATTTP